MTTNTDPLLKRAQANIIAWAKAYGDNSPSWLPPSGTGQLLEDIADALTQPASQEQADTVPRAKFNELLMQEHALSHAYVRLRHILGAMDPPRGSDAKAVWAYVEGVAQQKVAASQEQAQQPTLGALAKRRIFDAIRSAYDLGFNDARNARAVPGDGSPGYKGRDVEADHGGALLSSLNQCLKAQQPRGGDVSEYWGALAQQKADADMKRGVTMPVSYYASTVVAALLSSQKVATKPEPMTEHQRGSLVMEHLGPAALAGGQMSPLHAFTLGIEATEQHHGITSTSTKEQA